MEQCSAVAVQSFFLKGFKRAKNQGKPFSPFSHLQLTGLLLFCRCQIPRFPNFPPKSVYGNGGRSSFLSSNMERRRGSSSSSGTAFPYVLSGRQWKVREGVAHSTERPPSNSAAEAAATRRITHSEFSTEFFDERCLAGVLEKASLCPRDTSSKSNKCKFGSRNSRRFCETLANLDDNLDRHAAAERGGGRM